MRLSVSVPHVTGSGSEQNSKVISGNPPTLDPDLKWPVAAETRGLVHSVQVVQGDCSLGVGCGMSSTGLLDRSRLIIILVIMYFFVCYFSKLEQTAHNKAKNKTVQKQNNSSNNKNNF